MGNRIYNERTLGLYLVVVICLSSQDFYLKTLLKKFNTTSASLLLVSCGYPVHDMLTMILILAPQSNQEQYL